MNSSREAAPPTLVEGGLARYSQYQTKMAPWPPSPNRSVPPADDTETLISRSRPMVVANSDAMILQNQAYASYLRPSEILNARLMKVSVAFDF